MKKRQIIAHKYADIKILFQVGAVLFALCIVLSILGLVFYTNLTILFSVLTALFVALLAVVIVKYIIYMRMPNELIVTEKGRLVFAGQSFAVQDVQFVSAKWRYLLSGKPAFGKILSYGILVLSVGGRVYKLRYVADLDKAEKKLKALLIA